MMSPRFHARFLLVLIRQNQFDKEDMAGYQLGLRSTISPTIRHRLDGDPADTVERLYVLGDNRAVADFRDCYSVFNAVPNRQMFTMRELIVKPLV